MSADPVFHDGSGRRASRVRAALVIVALSVSAMGALFLISLAVGAVSQPQRFARRVSRQVIADDQKRAGLVLDRLQRRLRHSAPSPQSAPVLPPDGAVVMGFYAPWEEAGLDSLRANASRMTHVAPAWLHLAPGGLDIDTRDFDLVSNPANREVIEIARREGLRIVPILSNATGGKFDPAVLRRLLADPAAQSRLADRLAGWCRENRFQGINVDFEEVPDTAYAQMEEWLRRLRGRLGADGLEVSVDAETSVEPRMLARWAGAADYLVLMIYDQHDESGGPGPIAPLDWCEAMLDRALAAVPPGRLVMGIGSYAYDWKAGRRPAEAISYQQAMAAARGYREEAAPAVVRLDPDALNPTFTYEDDDGAAHRVWMLDGVTTFNQWSLARGRSLRGAALWALGAEDPTAWIVLDRARAASPAQPRELEVVRFPFEVSYAGQGEVLRVLSRPAEGRRTLTLDDDTGCISSSVYESYATTYLLQKSGYRPGKIVLTFDDGPDPVWTAKILDVLRENHAPGVFFVVGANVEAYPEIARRMVREGHEIGSHSFTHPNLGTVSTDRADLELSATLRVIESVTGVSTLLFRPPYNADSEPRTPDEVKPVDVADRLGYLTIGENVDPNDWDPRITEGDAEPRPRTSADIVRLTLEDLRQRKGTDSEGNIVLLHDAGGDRAQTVAALGPLIADLRAGGYEIVSLAELLGRPRAALMPPIPPSERALVGVDRITFTVMHLLQLLLTAGFVFAIAIGAGRLLVIVPLALAHARRARRAVWDPAYRPDVSVIIAAYNEEKTIAATIRSVLATDYPVREVIVVDDGSKDATSATVREAFAHDPRVLLITKENGGKASALNLAIESARGELLFGIDADTQLDPGAIGALARHFRDASLAAVAGNVQVGNVMNLVTAWQGVEYRTSQNMDRRAYALLNAITVIPGAIGMWRRSAVIEAGGYLTDTQAEDMDLTWRLRKRGYRADTEPAAVAWTEAPETWSALVGQRFRWAYGTLQCLWKHRDALGRFGWFGRLALPMIWLFQIVFQILGPLVDLQILVTAGMAVAAMAGSHGQEIASGYHTDALRLMLELYALFFCLELGAGILAYRADRASPWPLAWLFLQRFAYRQVMYIVMLKSLWRAILGSRQGWGKLARTGSVRRP